MIRVTPADPPRDFEERVALPGSRALQELIGDPTASTRSGPKRKAIAARIEDIPVSKLEPYWTAVLPELRAGYRDLCAYLAMRIHPASGAATVDHFVPKSKDKRRAYDWSNFRLATALVNTFKGEQEVIDPFEVTDGWFVLNLSNFEVAANPELEDAALIAQIDTTINERLRLNEPTFCRAREEYHDWYVGLKVGGPLPLAWLEAECPFVASELRRRGRLRPADRDADRG